MYRFKKMKNVLLYLRLSEVKRTQWTKERKQVTFYNFSMHDRGTGKRVQFPNSFKSLLLLNQVP
jgi:hypothetical protein